MAAVESLPKAMLGCMKADLERAAKSKPVVVAVVTAEGCHWCGDQKKALRAATAGRKDVRIVELPVDDPKCAALTAAYQDTPTTLYYAGGKKVAKVVGAQTVTEIRASIKGAAAKAPSGPACRVDGTASERLACMTGARKGA